MKRFFEGPTDYTRKELKLAEKKIEKDSKKWARAHGWHCRKFKAPSNNGVMDDIFVKKGRVVAIEFKRIEKEPTDLQDDEMLLWREAGGEAYWTNTARGVKQILESIYE